MSKSNILVVIFALVILLGILMLLAWFTQNLWNGPLKRALGEGAIKDIDIWTALGILTLSWILMGGITFANISHS